MAPSRLSVFGVLGIVALVLALSALQAGLPGAVSSRIAWLGAQTVSRNGAALAIAHLRWPQPRLPARSLCVLSIFKNETVNLREWASHYKWQGASAVVLLDNGGPGDDGSWRSELGGLENFVTVLDAPLRHAQEIQYNDVGRPWLEARGCEFVAVLDIDEFLYLDAPITPHQSLQTTILDAFDEATVSQLSCNWLMFGSSGLISHPRGRVRTNFTWRAAKAHSERKSIVRMSSLVRLRVHVHEVLGSTVACPPRLALNHYAIQSREYFEEVKMRRGDVAGMSNENVRTWAYFEAYDHHEFEDVTLRDLLLQRAASGDDS